ncbi:MAG: TIGR00303 family protein, partial [Methanobacteriaceae archaeon]|nr:TIGR00303 family protein [Methanobacteriaceae archaeon]
MYDGLTVYGSTEFLDNLIDKKSLFLCTIATTATSKIPGITGAGASPDLTEYTPAADVEMIVHDRPLCLTEIPKTVSDGGSAPTPAIITKAALNLAKIPFMVANAGVLVKPDLPYISLGEIPGKDIRTGKAVHNPKKIFENGKILAGMLSNLTDHLIIGESTPAGTTTALGVLTALGYDASFKVSGSLIENPHDLKKKVV